jgi:EAL domain-containing protein (putative c-di-GMP-specific phosphodiesterase class I)/GGDEF domain-containing protein
VLHNELLSALPDLIALVQRDGILLNHAGGAGLDALRPPPDALAQPIAAIWPEEVAVLIQQLVRRSIAARGVTEAEFHHLGVRYDVRASAQGPDRALCVIRRLLPTAAEAGEAMTSDGARRVERRSLQRRLKDSVSRAALRERPLAVTAIHLDGVSEIVTIVDAEFARQVTEAALARLAPQSTAAADGEIPWYLGQLSANLLIVVLDSGDRERIEVVIARLCGILREPVTQGDATFYLVPWAGVAILDEDAASAPSLLEHARSAAAEARRQGTDRVRFHSDTVKLRALARLDMARELRAAITNRDIRMRYVGRHDLASGRKVALVGYLRWQHRFRGEVRPAEFVKIAEATGLGRALSRAALTSLGEDFVALRLQESNDVRLSFGPLRHHVLHGQFLDDINEFLASGIVPPKRLELRITERSLAACDSRVLRSLTSLGVHLVVEDVALGMSSLELMARAPIEALQLGLSWVDTARHDPVARKLCHAVFSLASALGLTSIAKGIDERKQSEVLLALGCREGLGNFYEGLESSAETPSVPEAHGGS